MNTKSKFIAFLSAFIFLLFLTYCVEKTSLNDGPENIVSVDQSECVNCHTNEALLKDVADPLPDTGGDGGGEG